MNPATTEFVRQRFTEYYRKGNAGLPVLACPAGMGFCPF